MTSYFEGDLHMVAFGEKVSTLNPSKEYFFLIFLNFFRPSFLMLCQDEEPLIFPDVSGFVEGTESTTAALNRFSSVKPLPYPIECIYQKSTLQII